MTIPAGRLGRNKLERRLDFLIRFGLLSILVLAPLPFGSVETWAYSALEMSVAAVGLLWLYRLFLFPATRVAWSPLCLPPLGFVLLMGLQLIPLPPGVLRAVSPGTAAFYVQTIPGYGEGTRELATTEASLAGEASPTRAPWMPVSQVPHSTRTYLLKAVAFTLFLFLAINAFQAPGTTRWLLYAFVAAGAFEAFYGLLEYLSGHQHIFAYQKKYYTESATGTFINRNHFAAFLEMSLLVAVGLLFSRLRGPHAARSWRERLLTLTDRRASLNLILVFVITLIVVGLVLSYSRAGMVLGVSAAGLFGLSQLRRDWSFKRVALVAVLAIAVLVPAYGVGYWGLTGRYALLTDEITTPGGRLTVWQKTVEVFRDFPVLGTGIGTFQYVFPRYRAASVTAFYDYAHNDYVQVLAEGGLAGFAILATTLFLVGRLWLRRPARRVRATLIRSSIGCAIGAIALHELVDFGLQIPANFVALAVLLACLVLAIREEKHQIEQAWGEPEYA